ncbi:MAG: hypothetical protein JXA68_03510 [Ignavibacteriales bacterium]|nr:hypothetical protein [Ignavibacteriales bacterium]
MSPVIIVILIVIGIFIIVVLGNKYKWNNTIPDPFNVELEKNKLRSGTYFSGFPDLNVKIYFTYFIIESTKLLIYIYYPENRLITFILISNIKDISLQDKTYLDSRVTLTRFFTIGFWSFIFKKQEMKNGRFLVLKIQENEIEREILFHFDGENMIVYANKTYDALLNLLTQK